MKKYRLIMMLLLASITIGIFVIVPAVREAGAAGAPQVVSKTPADGTVIPDAWEGVVEITYDTPVQFGSGLIMLYWRVKDRDDQIIWWERVEGEESEKYFSLSPDGKTVTVDFDWGGDPILRGDKYNTDMNEYKRRYWIKVEPGAIVSRDDPPVSAAYWGDHNWNVYVQATPPQIESRYPVDRQTRVIAPAGTEFSVTFNENVLKWQPGAPVIYTYDYNNPYPSGSWDNELAVVCNDTRVTGNVLKFYLPKDLEANTTYGIMIPGPRNITGLNCDYIVDYPPSITPFPGLDYPEFYYELPQSGFWHFTTAQNYYAPYLEKKTPTSSAVEVSPDGAIMMEFDHMVESNTESSKYVCIKKHSDDSVVRQILNTVLLPAEEGRRELTIKNPGLSMNTKYYITIDSGAFVSSNNGLAYAGISDKSWSFTTTFETFEVRFFNGSAQIGQTQLIKYGEDAVPPPDPEREGYVFAGWDKSYENMMQDLDIYAVFKKICKLSYSAGEHGAIAGKTDQEVIEGENGTPVTAVPDTGYHFVRWSDGLATAERTDTSVTGDLSVTAEFAINVYTLAYAADAHGRLTGDTLQKVEHGSNGTPVTAVPDTGYHFVRWSDGLATAERTDTGVTGDLSITAEFAINVYTLAYAADAHGRLTGDTLQKVAHGSDGTPVMAVPDTGYHFVRWSDGVETAERTDTKVTGDLNVTAEFAINVYTLVYTAGAHGHLTGDALQKVEHGSDGTAVTAVPDTGYHFVKWSDGLTAAKRMDTGIKENLNVTTLFEINFYTVKFVDYDGTVLKTESVNYKASATAPKDLPSRKGYSFVGWDKDYKSVTSDMTVTAQYTINRYRVTFFDYDGSTIDIQYVPYGRKASAPDDPEREGYDFTGWDRDFSNVLSAISVTAQYEIKTFTVIFKNDDGSVLKTEVVEYGKKPTPPEAAERDGYVFTGWDSEFTGTGDTVIVAQYSLKEDREGKKDRESEKGCSWLWLWILIAVVVVALIVAYVKSRHVNKAKQ